MVRQLSFAAGTSVSSLSHSTKTSSRGKRDGPTITNPYTKKTRSEPSLKFHSGESKDYSPSNVEDDKELDYVPVTNQAVNNIMEGKGTWEEDAMTAMHRKAFYMKAYPVANRHELFPKPQSKSASMTTCRPKTEVDYIKNVIHHWGKGIEIRNMEDGEEKDRLLSFRRRNKVGNKYIHQYCLEEVWAPGDDKPRQVLRRLEAKKGSLDKTLQEGRIVISREELFDAINEWHQHSGHLGQERTWEYCRTKYWNVTQDHVKHYCTTCYTCMKKNPVTSKIKGSIKPIFSRSFRDRFQLDLVDFRRLRKRDPFGVLMRWVMTLKDHATGITYICALPRKQAHLIAYKLQEIFGFIGYPKIFHTDNGKEFTAKCVLQFLRNLNPNIVSVTGRPRRPRDQGSVENVNKMVKRVLGSVLAERRLSGQNPNWTEVLGSVAAAINSQCGRCKNDVSAYEAVYGDKYDHPMSCSKSEARRCWTLSDRMKVTNDPEFEEFCRENYFIVDGNEDDTNNEGGLNEEDAPDNDDDGYFSDDELPQDETDEVTDEWLLSHLMDDTSSVASAKSSCISAKKAPPDDVGGDNEEVDLDFVVDDDYVGSMMAEDYVEPAQHSSLSAKKAPPDDVGGDTDKKVDLDFVVDDDDVGAMAEDYVEPAQHSSPLLHTNSFDKAVTTNMCKATLSFDDAVRSNMCKETKSSGDEPPYNRWLELIDKRRAKNKPSLELSEVSRARVNTLFPIVYCTDHHNQFDNNHYWHPCILKKVGRELYEVLDANEDLKLVKEELEFTGEEGLRYLWGLVYKHPSLAFVTTFRNQVLKTCEGNDTKKVTQSVTTTSSDVHDKNGIRFAPSCESKCFIGDEKCAHEDLFRVELNQVGQYVVFPSVWWHHGYISINTPDNIIFTAQLFATPRSDIGSSQRSLRKTSNTKTYSQGTVDSTLVNTLMTDLYMNWDEDYSATKFPPAKNFFGKVDRDKNRHILHDQIHKVPKIQRLVLAIEEEVGDITVDSVWLIKKTIADDGFQEWHQDMKHKITKTIVVNVGIVSSKDDLAPVLCIDDDKAHTPELVLRKRIKQSNIQWAPLAEGWKLVAKRKTSEHYLQPYLDCPICSPNKKNQICALGKKYIHDYTFGQDWYLSNFVSGFCVLVQHNIHDERPSYQTPGIIVKYIVCPGVPNVPMTKADVESYHQVTHFVSTVYNRSHFAVLLFDLEARQVTVYDGLPCRLKKWEAHITYILRKYGLEDYKDMPQVDLISRTDCGEVLMLFFSDENKGPWAVSKDPKLKQFDRINCGPIACLKVMEICGIIPKSSVAEAHKMHKQGYRGIVMEYYKRFMQRYERDMWYNVSGATAKKIAHDMENEEHDKKDTEDVESDEPSSVDFTSSPDNSGSKAHLDYSHETHKVAMEKKNKRQEEKAKQALKQCGQAALKSGVSPGAVVTLKVDYRTFYNPEGLVAIVYEFNPRTGGIKTCCEHGVITHDGSQGVYVVAVDRYVLNAPAGTYIPLPEKLAEVRKKVEDGLFDERKSPRISYSKMHQHQINANSPIKKSKGCGCNKGKCTKNCGCRKKKLSCHSGCACNGNCGG